MDRFGSAAPDMLESIAREVGSLQGKRLTIRAHLGRCKVVEREGVLEAAHAHLFVLRVQETTGDTRRISYGYVDVLRRTVELVDSVSGQPLLACLQTGYSETQSPMARGRDAVASSRQEPVLRIDRDSEPGPQSPDRSASHHDPQDERSRVSRVEVDQLVNIATATSSASGVLGLITAFGPALSPASAVAAAVVSGVVGAAIAAAASRPRQAKGR